MVAQRQLTEEERRQLLAHTLASAPANTRTQLLNRPRALEHFWTEESISMKVGIVVMAIICVLALLAIFYIGGAYLIDKFTKYHMDIVHDDAANRAYYKAHPKK